MSTQNVDFGSILDFTEKTYTMTMKNTSKMPIEYTWKFAEDAKFKVLSDGI
jgi:hypothetical protein